MTALIPELDFDATNVERIFYQDELIIEYQAFPDIPVRYAKRQHDGLGHTYLSEPVWDPAMLDEDLRIQRAGIKNALLLPLCDEYLNLLQQLSTLAESAARERWLARQAASPSTSDWETASLLDEVRAVAGEGKQLGKEWWFICPFHQEKTASLHVDPVKKVFHCFGCGKQGGVVDFRKLTGG